MNVLLIGTDTLHRRFIINSLLDKGINLNTCIFQTISYKSTFRTNPLWAKFEKTELLKRFNKKTRLDLRRVKKIIKIKNLSSITNECKKEISKSDFVIVSGADLIKGQLLEMLRLKALNVHMGIAEKYRGLDSNLWAWYHKDYKNIGVTLHKLNKDLDTGQIFKTQSIKINKKTKIWLLRYFESDLAVKLLKVALNCSEKKKLILRKQKKIGRYYSFMPSVIKNKMNYNVILSLIIGICLSDYFIKII